MSINDHLLIDKYFQGDLRPEEKKLFEEKLSTDTAFSEEVEIHQQALQYIDQEGHQMLKKRLDEKGKAIDRASSIKKWGGLLGIAIAAMLVFYFSGIFQASSPDVKEEGLQPSGTPEIQSSQPFTDDTLKKEDNDRMDYHPNPTETAPLQKKAIKQNTDELFAAYYSPFEDEGLQSSLRGQDDHPAASDLFIGAYLEGNYTEALSLFENMVEYDRQNDNMLLIRALCLIEKREYNQSINQLEQIIMRDQSRYMSASKWYLALSYIKMGHLEKAKNQLRKLEQDISSGYDQKAHAILKEL